MFVLYCVWSGVRSPGEFDVLVHLQFKVDPFGTTFVWRHCTHPTGGRPFTLNTKNLPDAGLPEALPFFG